MNDLTKEEKAAISALKRLSKKWPPSLWLFANGLHISIMRTGKNGEHVTDGEGGGFNQDYRVDSVDIDNDGGDW